MVGEGGPGCTKHLSGSDNGGIAWGQKQCCPGHSSRSKADLAGSKEVSWGGKEVLGRETPGHPGCWRPLIPDSSLRSRAHATSKQTPIPLLPLPHSQSLSSGFKESLNIYFKSFRKILQNSRQLTQIKINKSKGRESVILLSR